MTPTSPDDEPRRDSFTRQRVRAGGLTIAYRAEPRDDDAPPLVLIHGLGMSSRAFVPLMPWLARDARVLAPDLPGCGASDKPREPLSVRQLVTVLADWLDAVGVERAHVLGHSVGAQVACELAAAHPHRVERLVLAAPTPDTHPVPAWRLASRLALDGLQEPPSLVVTASLDYLRARPSQMWRMLGKALRQDVEGRARRVTAPTLVVRGTRDPVCRREWADELAALLPRGQAAHLPGGTHGLQAQSPREFASVIKDFLLAESEFGRV